MSHRIRPGLQRPGAPTAGTKVHRVCREGIDLWVVEGGRRVIMAINRKQLNGVMQARIADANTMNVTVSVRVDKQLVPVIGMSLKRTDATAVGSID